MCADSFPGADESGQEWPGEARLCSQIAADRESADHLKPCSPVVRLLLDSAVEKNLSGALAGL
jgi:hypothetical protein